ncbi:MAG: N-acetylmuramoyl-L-alanine amidase [Bryobacterales bacterium]|nr:N-acetylmuramoyl-L-alanine amidase [Bryobacterales bacterium]
MELPKLSWSCWYYRWVEGRATRIDDPVKRLRYLRKAMPASYAADRRPHFPVWLPVVSALLVAMVAIPNHDAPQRLLWREVQAPVRQTQVVPVAQVWLVESRDTYEVYSNGLRIETQGAVINESRLTNRSRDGKLEIVAGQVAPAGIVFHTTESHIAPFESAHNLRLQRVGQWLKDFVAQNRSYHYLIDRFGRVHRIVRESDAAYHAGASLWGDGKTVWVNLNHSFLAIAFESQTAAGDRISESVTPAQVHTAATLTAMLRSKYNFDPANCVTHAQVSVNPSNMRIGLHTDWGANFPFAEVGLPDNYGQPLAAIYKFGFVADDAYLAATGPRLRRGVDHAEGALREQATALNVAVATHRHALQQQYRNMMGALPKHLAVATGERKEKTP